MELVFNQFKNRLRLRVTVYEQGLRQPVDFTSASSVYLFFPKDNLTVNASYKNAEGILEFNQIGYSGLSEGEHVARLVVDGHVIAHEDMGELVVRVY